MQVIKPMSLGLGTRPIEHRGRMALCVSAMLYFPFNDGSAPTLWSEPSMWKFLATEMEGQPLIDEGVVKTTAEYLVRGMACPPGGRPQPACAVRARVGSLEKTLAVHGHRFWANGRATAPMPFERMPLTWGFTWGGAEVSENPLGRGKSRLPIDGIEEHWLPNVEYADRLVAQPGQAGTPACFERIDPMWPQRARWRGTFDEAWYKTHAPAFPPDLDWQHFNMASADQWFPQGLQGDEPFAFEHMHPEKPMVGGRLPGLTVRCIVQYTKDAKSADGQPVTGPLGKFRDVPMKPTTLWFFPHVECGIVILQGLLPVTEDDGADVGLLMLGVERIGQPREQTHYLDILAKRMDPAYGALWALRDSDLLPEGLSTQDPAFDEQQAEYKLEGFVGDNQFRRAEMQVAKLRDQVKAMGLDPDKYNLKPPVRPKTPTLEELPRYVEQEVLKAQALQAESLRQAEADVARAEALAKANKIDLAKQQSGMRGPPTFNAAAEFKKLSSVMPKTTPADAFKRLEGRLAQAEDAQRLSYWMSAHRQPPALPVLPAEAARMRTALQQLLDAKLPARGAKLTGVDLAGVDLRGVDLSGAQLESANLQGAQLQGANLSFAVLAHADLSGANLTNATLQGTNLGKAKLHRTVFEAAMMDGAILSGADFEGALFRGASAKGVDVAETAFKASDWSQTLATGLTMIKSKIEGVAFAGADLSKCVFIECEFKRCNFAGARLQGVNFVGCTGEDVHFDRAELAQSVFTQSCKFPGFRAPGAVLRESNLRGAVLTGAFLDAAVLDGADLSEADCTGARMSGVSLRGAMMVRTVLRGALMPRANLMQAVLQKADLRGTDLRLSNLYGSDLSRVWRDDLTLIDGANLDRARTHPLRKEAPAAS